MAIETFTVDAKLLQELGERLVGRPDIALAELIKNSFDADATSVVIEFDGDSISVADDGHGMSRLAFVRRWMRIGTAQKAEDRFSPGLGRGLTGSKGVGRLAAQLLARRLELYSRALIDPSQPDTSRYRRAIAARIDWPQALREKDLTDVKVELTQDEPVSEFPGGSRHGTRIVMRGLTSEWGPAQFEALARQIWALQPPFALPGGEAQAFSVKLVTPRADVQETFDRQMGALLDIADAVVTGRLLDEDESPPRHAERFVLTDPGEAVDEEGVIPDSGQPVDRIAVAPAGPTRLALLNVRVVDSTTQNFVVEIPNCQLDRFDFEIRVFDLIRRQPRGILVPVARKYLSEFGGVHIYDSGFRLPYYGPNTDWLRLELDHARRLSRSRLLPDNLQVHNAMQDLPSNKRVFGAVNVSTAHEHREAVAEGRRQAESLAIQITRDRLADNVAFGQLTRTVRLGLDLYAIARSRSKALRTLGKARAPRKAVQEVAHASAAVEAVRDQIPSETYETVADAIANVSREIKDRNEEARVYASLLGSLATAGMTSLAYEHEISAQRGKIEAIARQMDRLASEVGGAASVELAEVTEKLRRWGQRAERIRGLFRPLLEEESRTTLGLYEARDIIEEVVDTIAVLQRKARVNFARVPADLVLPAGTFTAWSAVIQNLLTNAFRATIDTKPALIQIDGGVDKKRRWLRIQDNGHGGVDPATSARLFKPFERGAHDSRRARALGLGGSGLGLTIVKMIIDDVGSTIAFEEPDEGWSTSVRISWEE